MHSIVDVAGCILERYGAMPTMKLQKLAFYSQARALVVNGAPLFGEDFEAWENGRYRPRSTCCIKAGFSFTRGISDAPVVETLRLTPAQRRPSTAPADSCQPFPETSFPR